MTPAEPPSDNLIAEFWEWWADARHAVAHNIHDRTQPVDPTVRDVLRALHPELSIALQPGLTAEHALAISGRTPGAELAARRILATAPRADADWEYTDLIAGIADPRQLVYISGDLEVRMTDARARLLFWEHVNTLIVVLYHPMWSRLPDETQTGIAGNVLNAVAGDLPPDYQLQCLCSFGDPDEPVDLGELTEHGQISEPLDLAELARRIDRLSPT